MEILGGRYGSDIPFYCYNREDLGDGQMPPFNAEEGQKWLMREIEAIKPEFIIFDSVMSLLIGSMSEEESWEPVKHLVRRITSRRIAQLWLHHTGHDTTRSFGTKTREWEMDTVVRLTWADEERTAIDFDFRKARLRTPGNIEPFKARRLRCGEDGWIPDTGLDKAKSGRGVSDLAKVKRALTDAYERLADDIGRRRRSLGLTASWSRKCRSTASVTR